MTYSKPMGMMYATAGLGMGPSGISPPFRKYGFRSFDGLGALGFDRLASGRTRTFVFSITAVRGLRSGTAWQVPRRITEHMLMQSLRNAEAGWAEGGRIWGRFVLPLGSPYIEDAAERRRRLALALQQAAQSLGPDVSFEVAGYGRIPRSAPASAPAAPTPSGQTSTPTTTSDTEAAQSSTVSVMDLQRTLRDRGFNPGTLDGKWGRNTSGALQQAAQAAGVSLNASDAVGSADKRSVTLPSNVWSGVQGLPRRQVSSSTPPAPPAPAITVTDIAPEVEGEGGVPDWLPWAIGATVLVGVGGYFVYRGRQQRAVAANRRRRRRRRSSRRRR